MALATTCPQCKTSFKVVPDQLKLKRGLVRCGVCQNVFSGIDYLRYVDDARAAARAPRDGTPATGPTGTDGHPEPVATPQPASQASSPAVSQPPTSLVPHAAPGVTVPVAGTPYAAPPARGPGEDAATTARYGASWTPGTAPAGRDAPSEDPWDDPTRPWPPDDGPRTIIEDGDDLKTAFFLPDTTFGPTVFGAVPEEPPAFGPATAARPSDPAPSVSASDVPAAEVPASPPASPPDTPPDTAAALPATLSARPMPGADPAIRATPPTDVPAPGDGAGPEYLVVPPLRPAAAAPERRTRSAEVEIPADELARARARRIAGPARRAPGTSMGTRIAAVALATLLAAQMVIGWRDTIAARMPSIAPVLASVMGAFGLQLAPPRNLDALTIESHDLKPDAPGVLQLSVVLRNRADHAVGWPAIELSLTDSTGALQVRKVIPAETYLDAASVAAGIAPRTERPLRIALEHGGLAPTGYTVALFHP